MCCVVPYCTVLYCTVLYCTVLYCTVLYCTVLYCTVLYCTVLYCTVRLPREVSFCLVEACFGFRASGSGAESHKCEETRCACRSVERCTHDSARDRRCYRCCEITINLNANTPSQTPHPNAAGMTRPPGLEGVVCGKLTQRLAMSSLRAQCCKAQGLRLLSEYFRLDHTIYLSYICIYTYIYI